MITKKNNQNIIKKRDLLKRKLNFIFTSELIIAKLNNVIIINNYNINKNCINNIVRNYVIIVEICKCKFDFINFNDLKIILIIITITSI